MTMEELKRELDEAKEDIKNLYGRTNKFSLELVTLTTKLDNMMLTMGELKESINRLSSRPTQLWDKLLLGIVGAVAAAIGSALAALVLKG